MTAMGGVLHTKASLDVDFVIVKSVLAAKYKVFDFIHCFIKATRLSLSPPPCPHPIRGFW